MANLFIPTTKKYNRDINKQFCQAKKAANNLKNDKSRVLIFNYVL